MAPMRSLVVLAVACLVVDQVAAMDIRGIRPTHIQHYKPSTGRFKCLDGTREIDFKQVNDDFCDCPDGSDEPDCCDGSDELSGCKNTCLEKNAAVREGLKQKLADYKKALKTKQVLLESAPAKRHHIKQRMQELPKEVTAAEAKAAALASEKEEAAEVYKTLEEEESRKSQEAQAEQEAASKAEAEQQADHEHPETLEHPAEGSKGSEQETDEERGRRIAAQWTTDPDAAARAEEGEAAADGDGVAEERSENEEAQEVGEVEAAEITAARQKFEELERQHTEAVNEVQRLQGEQEEVKRQLPHEKDRWLGLAGTCVDAREAAYTYRGCLFGKAAQIDNGAGHETSLGNWKGFSDDMTKAMWDGGDFCANAPQRSFTVELECGTETKAWGASEPSTCTYTAKMSTPVACDEKGLEQIESELQKLLDEEAAIAKEIAEAEAARAAAAEVKDEL